MRKKNENSQLPLQHKGTVIEALIYMKEAQSDFTADIQWEATVLRYVMCTVFCVPGTMNNIRTVVSKYSDTR